METLAMLRFETPAYLALLAVVPLLVALSFRSLAGLGRVRRVLAIAVRCLVVLVMILALAGAQWPETIDDLSVIFLVDRSKSIPRDLQEQAFDYLSRAREGRPTDDRMGVIAFDRVADVQQLPGTELAIDHITEPLDPDQTNLAAALQLALALKPSDTAAHIVVISDGNENVGDVLDEAERFSAAGIPIDVLPIQYEHVNEVVFEQLKAPPTATTEETINLQMLIRSQQPVSGKLLLRHNEKLLDLNGDAPGAGYAVELNRGPNRRTIPVPLRAAGAHRFEAQFVPDDERYDTIDSNNVGRAFTVVSGQGKILILTTTEDLHRAAVGPHP